VTAVVTTGASNDLQRPLARPQYLDHGLRHEAKTAQPRLWFRKTTRLFIGREHGTDQELPEDVTHRLSTKEEVADAHRQALPAGRPFSPQRG